MTRQPKMIGELARMAHYYPTKESLRKALECDERRCTEGETLEIRQRAETHALDLRRVAMARGWRLD